MAAVKSQSVRTSSTSSRSVDLVARPPPTSSATRPTPSWRFSARWVATKTLSSTDSSANTWGFWNVLTRPRAATSSGRRPPMFSPFHNTAGAGRREPRDHVEERRLPGAVRPDDAEDFAGRDHERHVRDGDEAAEAFGDGAHLKQHAAPSTPRAIPRCRGA